MWEKGQRKKKNKAGEQRNNRTASPTLSYFVIFRFNLLTKLDFLHSLILKLVLLIFGTHLLVVHNLLLNPICLFLFRSGKKTYSTEVFKNGFWNHLCLAWGNVLGDYAFFINGTKVVKGVLQVTNSIPANGLLIIGGQKSPAHLENPFVGKMRCVQMWDNYLPDSGIAALFQNDRCEKLFQPFFNWNEVKSGTGVGDVEWKEPSSFTEPDKG